MELHAGDARHLVGQIVGDGGVQGKDADQRPGQEGGETAVEQLPRQIGAHRQAAVPDEGEHLTVDRQPCPPQYYCNLSACRISEGSRYS